MFVAFLLSGVLTLLVLFCYKGRLKQPGWELEDAWADIMLSNVFKFSLFQTCLFGFLSLVSRILIWTL